MKCFSEETLKKQIHNSLQVTFKKTIDNPVVKADEAWKILSEQLSCILGTTVHNQWFKPVKPLVLNNNILLLQTKDQFSERWINTHYQELAETLLTTQNKKLSCFFMAPIK